MTSLMISHSGTPGQNGPSYHSMCYRAGCGCWRRCRRPSRNCIHLLEWVERHGIENLPERPTASEFYFHLPLGLVDLQHLRGNPEASSTD